MKEFKDKCGRVVVPGDLIVYGHALGRCAGLRYGIALGSHVAKETWSDRKKTHLTVIGVDSDWDDEPAKLCRKGTLQFGDRVLVVTREQIPTSILKVLDTVDINDLPKGK